MGNYLSIMKEQWGDRLLYTDAGDQFQGGLEGRFEPGNIIMDFFNALNLDKSALGNHEFDFGLPFLNNYMNSSKFDWIIDNIKDINTGKYIVFPHQKKSMIVEVGDLKIKLGIIGLATKETPASFEPAIDYVVIKIPRWPFDKFKGISREVGVQMKATGEVMAIGRTFEEAFQKALRSLDMGFDGFEYVEWSEEDLAHPTDLIYFQIYSAIKDGMDIDKIREITKIDNFFLYKIKNIVEFENDITAEKLDDEEYLRKAKQMGCSNKRLAELSGQTEEYIKNLLTRYNIKQSYKMVDTCAAEFEAKTPYYYSSYDKGNELTSTTKKKVVILGAGPIRIGQGIEFDYCCVHSSLALKEEGIETILINNNPETVSTDYDISDKLFFEPLTYEDVMGVIEQEKPDGVIVQFGGQTSINLAVPLANAGVKIWGTPYDSIDRVEDRELFAELLEKLHIHQAPYGTANSFEEAKEIAERITFPVLVRPSYVIGGRAMEIVYDMNELEEYMKEAVKVSPDHPILVDKFLEDAIELDVDLLCDGEDVFIAGIMEHIEVFIAGIMEHIEEAGVHSGDSACVIPPQTIPEHILNTIREHSTKLALELDVKGLMNIQYAVKLDEEMVYIIEANPRASRTVPFVSKAIGVPLAKVATWIMNGAKLRDFGLEKEIKIGHVAVKESVFPFLKLPESDTVLGPEMKSTGESIGIDDSFGMAFYKSQLSANMELPKAGKIFLSVKEADKKKIRPIAEKAANLGFEIVATAGTGDATRLDSVEKILKVSQGSPNIRDAILNNEIDLIINTSEGKQSAKDGYIIRRLAIELGIPYVTTLAGARAVLNAIEAVQNNEINVKSLNEYVDGE